MKKVRVKVDWDGKGYVVSNKTVIHDLKSANDEETGIKIFYRGSYKTQGLGKFSTEIDFT